MKRKVALIMAAVLMVVSLGACSSTTSSSYGTESAESENNVRNSGEKVTLTVWQLKPEIADTLPEVFEVYMKENPNVEIVVDRRVEMIMIQRSKLRWHPVFILIYVW